MRWFSRIGESSRGLILRVASSADQPWARVLGLLAVAATLAGGVIWIESRFSSRPSAQGPLRLELEVRRPGDSAWHPSTSEIVVEPDSNLHVRIVYKNGASRWLSRLQLRTDISPDLDLVPESLKWLPGGLESSQSLADGSLQGSGFVLGDLAPRGSGAGGRIEFDLRVGTPHACTALIVGFLKAAGVKETSAMLTMPFDFDNDGRSEPVCVKPSLKPSDADWLRPAGGWTPGRPVLDWEVAAQRVGFVEGPVFNSFINTGVYGDERAFLDAKSVEASEPGSFHDVFPYPLSAGVVLVRAYIHNNANQSLNEDGSGVAHGTSIRVDLPTGTEKALRIRAYLSSDNAQPLEITDTVEFKDVEPFRLRYRLGSTTIVNQAHPEGLKLADGIATRGVLLGFQDMNGDFPACFEHSAYVTFLLEVLRP